MNANDTEDGGVEQHELSAGELALAQAVYNTSFEEMDEWKQKQFKRLLSGMPDHMRAGLDGNLLSKDQLAEGMDDVFRNMAENGDIPEEWKDGASVFAMGLKKKFGLGDNDEVSAE